MDSTEVFRTNQKNIERFVSLIDPYYSDHKYDSAYQNSYLIQGTRLPLADCSVQQVGLRKEEVLEIDFLENLNCRQPLQYEVVGVCRLSLIADILIFSNNN